MNKAQQKRYNSLYKRHLNALKRQGKSASTIDVYSRALRRITAFSNRCPDELSEHDLEQYFGSLVDSHSWSTVKSDRCGLQFFYKYVLKKQWDWINIIKPPKVKSLPDILTPQQIEHVINSTREIRYQTYILSTYSMGLRLGEALNLTVGDIDSQLMRVHVRNGKNGKDRFITLPSRSLLALRHYWSTHRHPKLLFPGGKTPEQQYAAKVPMDRGGLQKSFQAIIKSCGIRKRITIHSLRHCYGTHLSEAGVNLIAIQKEMGHESVKTTSVYTQLTGPIEQNTSDIINQMIDKLNIDWHKEV